jgi:hypothetical protein
MNSSPDNATFASGIFDDNELNTVDNVEQVIDSRGNSGVVFYLSSYPTEAAERARGGYKIPAKQFNWELES